MQLVGNVGMLWPQNPTSLFPQLQLCRASDASRLLKSIAIRDCKNLDMTDNAPDSQEDVVES